ncbi:hypothetical protein LCGC14_0799760 [marine sediment metagenome]|uniref:Uncharacterized protein n=1 Tax=marine sediment metagenome TaxID=412755 RepID=A0A0F9Q9X3_9ZZZZ
MTDETETKAPTVEELQAKVSRLTTQVAEDTKAVEAATGNFKSVMKSGDVDKALEAADSRTKAQATLAKSTSQLKTATGAVTSANYAANAENIATIHNQVRDGKLNMGDAFSRLEGLGVTKLTIERSEESGKLVINSAGPTVKRPRSSGGGTGSRGQSLTVDGEEFASASAAMRNFYPDSGPLNRDSIISKLTNAGHEVA